MKLMQYFIPDQSKRTSNNPSQTNHPTRLVKVSWILWRNMSRDSLHAWWK